jgi:hypothetical protein
MTGIGLGILGLLAALAATALGDVVSEKVRDRLDCLPRAILRLAARRLDPELRESFYGDEWLPELTYILRGGESRPVTRLVHGTRYAMGILVTAPRIANLPVRARRRAAVPELAVLLAVGLVVGVLRALPIVLLGGLLGNLLGALVLGTGTTVLAIVYARKGSRPRTRRRRGRGD